MPDLVGSIQEYIDAHNNDPRPYVWTATAESILAKVASHTAQRDTSDERTTGGSTGHHQLPGPAA